MPSTDHVLCKSLLKGVSRSFYLNTVTLREPIMTHVMISYLLCRIADTIEDDPKITRNRKKELLISFKNLLCTTKKDYSILDLGILEFDSTENEMELMKKIRTVFKIYDTFPTNIQNIISKYVHILIDGMIDFVTKQEDKLNKIATVSELDEYCYYVAGVVGELLTDIFAEDSPHIDSNIKSYLDDRKIQFGLGLQYTNIIKDVYKDYERDWIYYPEELFQKYNIDIDQFFKNDHKSLSYQLIGDMIKLALERLDKSIEYTLKIPKKELSIRLFLLWPLFFALETLKEITRRKDELLSGVNVKISRRKVKYIIFKTTLFSYSNFCLHRMYRKTKKLILK